MNAVTKLEIAALLKPAQAVYQHLISDEEVIGYYQALRSYHRLYIYRAVSKHIASSKFFPRPNEIIDLITTDMMTWTYPNSKFDEEVLWQMAVRSLSSPDDFTEQELIEIAKKTGHQLYSGEL